MKFGVQLPHFGPDCTKERLLDTVRSAEALGYDSVWVRDHLYIPREHQQHGGMQEDIIVEPMLTLAAASAITSSVTLGTNILIPTRHPLKLSQNINSLCYLSDDRVIAGIGAGHFRQEFEALGIPYDERPQIMRETLEIVQRTMTGSNVDYDGELYQFENVTITPQPQDPVPVWYGGGSFTSVRRAVAYADGWCPPKMTFEKLDERVELLEEERAASGATTTFCPKSLISVHEDHQTALDAMNMDALIEDVNRSHKGTYRTMEDIAGVFVAGSPHACAEGIQRFIDMGADHFILDLRHTFDMIDDELELFVDEVIPRLDQ